MSQFEDKKKALFDCLDAAEKSVNRTNVCVYDEDFERRDNERNRRNSQIDKYKNKSSIFKRPALPINKCLQARKRADHERNPESYTHYSLEDVSDMSDRMNSSAAYNFLREIEDRKINKQEEEGGSSDKIVFKNSKKLKPKDEDTEPVEKKIRGNKFLMPEYVIGEKQRTKQVKRDKPSSSVDKSKQLKLSHLDEEEED